MMSEARGKIFMVGAFPPPVHGMALVNAAVLEQLRGEGAKPVVINLAAASLNRSLSTRLGRLPRVLRGLICLLTSRRASGGVLYMSVSGGLGQVYELLFLFVARLHEMRIYLHHHTFACLDHRSWLTRSLVSMAGDSAVHVALSAGMAARLRALYGTKRTAAVSNAVFLLDADSSVSSCRQRCETLGFISNISAEKGVFKFLNLMAEIEAEGLLAQGKIAGPFQDAETERRVRERLARMKNVELLGPVYGYEKDNFFASIDVLIFPTHYANEAEPIVNLEAMSRGIPVIAYGRGCIPEIIGMKAGLVIEPGKPFVPEALRQIREWLDAPRALEHASNAAMQQFKRLREESSERWKSLIEEMTKAV